MPMNYAGPDLTNRRPARFGSIGGVGPQPPMQWGSFGQNLPVEQAPPIRPEGASLMRRPGVMDQGMDRIASGIIGSLGASKMPQGGGSLTDRMPFGGIKRPPMGGVNRFPPMGETGPQGGIAGGIAGALGARKRGLPARGTGGILSSYAGLGPMRRY